MHNLSKYMSMCSILLGIVLAFYFVLFSKNKYNIAIAFTWLLFMIIIAVLVEKIDDNIFEPIFLFSIMYLTGCFSSLYLVCTDFAKNRYVHLVEYRQDFVLLYNKSVIYYFIGYICFLIGYMSIKKSQTGMRIKYTNKKKMPDIHIKIVSFVCVFLGIINFFYNVYHFAYGSIVVYLKNMSFRAEEFSTGGTTLGYVFLMVGVYLVMFYYLRNGKKLDIPFYILAIFSALVIVSMGRLYFTIAYMLSLLVIKYYDDCDKYETKTINKKYVAICGFLSLCGVGAYLFRLITNYDYNNLIQTSMLEFIILQIKNLFSYAFDTGNTVNMAILPKIIDSWNYEIGFLYGESILTPLNSIFHTNFPIVSSIVREKWFYQATNGNLPVTVIGDLYINFGIIGIVIGMFLLGYFFKAFYVFLLRKKTYWNVFIYSIVLTNFIAILPKCDFSNFPLFEILFYGGIIFLVKAFSEIKLNFPGGF